MQALPRIQQIFFFFHQHFVRSCLNLIITGGKDDDALRTSAIVDSNNNQLSAKAELSRATIQAIVNGWGGPVIYYLRTAPLEECRFNRKIQHDSHQNLHGCIFLKNFDGNLSLVKQIAIILERKWKFMWLELLE